MDLTILPNFSQICSSQISLTYLAILSIGCGQKGLKKAYQGSDFFKFQAKLETVSKCQREREQSEA